MRLYNSLTQQIEPFIPNGNKVTIYVCGITPYDTTHLGHAFTYIIFDTLIRFLRSQNYEVIYTQNVTDIDDPLFERARKPGTPPTHYTKVTEEIPMIITIVQKLFDQGFAYASGDNVYFDVKK